MPTYLKRDKGVRGDVTLPLPPTHKKMYQAEEDDGEFVIVVSGDGDDAD
jgi:hypothetical protein